MVEMPECTVGPRPTVVLVLRPDDKDWTWVLERPCPECGFDASSCAREDVAALVRENASDWQRLHKEGAIRAGRVDASRWSALEYACHVRDVYVRYSARIDLMLRGDDPLYPNWDQDQSAVDDRYDEQEPTRVIAELIAAAGRVATQLDGVSGATWQRRGRRGDGAAFTVESIARYMVHDPIHHIWDVTKGT